MARVGACGNERAGRGGGTTFAFCAHAPRFRRLPLSLLSAKNRLDFSPSPLSHCSRRSLGSVLPVFIMYTALKTTEDIAFGIYDLRLATNAVKFQKYVFPFGFWRDCGSLGRGWDGVRWGGGWVGGGHWNYFTL